MITVPVLEKFRDDRQIGELKIDKAKIPSGAEYYFLAIAVSNKIGDSNKKLYAIAIQTDDEVIAYLKQLGKIK